MMPQGRKWGRYHWGGNRRQRVTVGLGYLYNLLRKLNAVRLTRWLMRRPWHVADELRPDGKWVKVMAYPKHMRPTVADVMNRAAAKRAKDLAVTTTTPPNVVPPKPVKLATVRLKKGMRLWQLVDGQVVEVSVNGLSKERRAHVNPGLPLVAALNAENAKRKLGVR